LFLTGLEENRCLGDFRRMSHSSDTDSPFFPQSAGATAAPDYSLEACCLAEGARVIAGMDEAGRGPLAGPVVAAAVILDRENIPNGLNDSKKLNATARLTLFTQIAATAQIAWCALRSDEIDRLNILQATMLAMTRAADFLPVRPDAVLIDGREVPIGLRGPGKAVIGGDAICQSIAAASIVAKVIRDKMMVRADEQYPGYEFSKNKGYGTQTHRDAIARIGPCEIHRWSFSPMTGLKSAAARLRRI
jgi:ribonuclease HII